jgi:hypothetical protein
MVKSIPAEVYDIGEAVSFAIAHCPFCNEKNVVAEHSSTCSHYICYRNGCMEFKESKEVELRRTQKYVWICPSCGAYVYSDIGYEIGHKIKCDCCCAETIVGNIIQ